MGNVTPPGGGLASGSNYFITGGGVNLPNPVVTVTVTQPIVAAYGFSIQMNCQPAPNSTNVWQQYGFVFDTSGAGLPVIKWFINLWPTSSYANALNPPPSTLVDIYQVMIENIPLGELGATIPTGYVFKVELGNDEYANISQVKFTVTDNNGNITTTGWIGLASLHLNNGTGNLLGTGAICPITSMMLVIVGKYNDQYTFLYQGGGVIQYQSEDLIWATGLIPPNIIKYVPTGETSDVAYAEMSSDDDTGLSQIFTTQWPPAYTPGGRCAVSQQMGLAQTNFYGVDRAGQLIVFYSSAGGHWDNQLGLGPVCWGKPNTALAVGALAGFPDQTCVFMFAQNYRLSMFWVVGSGPWSGPLDIGQLLKVDAKNQNRHAHAGANLAISEQFGANNQTDVFVVDTTGTLNVYWCQNGTKWGGPVLVGATGILPEAAPLAACQQMGAPNQTDVFVVDNNGTLQVFWVQGANNWSPEPAPIGPSGHFNAGAFVAAGPGYDASNRTDVYAVDKYGSICVLSVVATNPWSQQPVFIGPPNAAPPGAPIAVCERADTQGQTDVYVVDGSGTLWVYSRAPGAVWTRDAGTQIGPAGLAPNSKQASRQTRGSYVVACPQYGVTGQTDVFLINQTGNSAPGWPMVAWVEGESGWNGPAALSNQV
jgi:hypothetical protein